MNEVKDERVKQVAVGAVILMTIAILVPSALLGWRLVPGLWGEWLGMVIGLMTTPFVMETTFLILGIVLVVTINHWRRTKEGDDFVFLDQINAQDAPKDLPDHAKWALYREKPQDPITLSLLEKAEGALAIGDYTMATQWISEMDSTELKQVETLNLRIELAEATGKLELLAELRAELAAKIGAAS
jgi:uncharacterized membrane protein